MDELPAIKKLAGAEQEEFTDAIKQPIKVDDKVAVALVGSIASAEIAVGKIHSYEGKDRFGNPMFYVTLTAGAAPAPYPSRKLVSKYAIVKIS